MVLELKSLEAASLLRPLLSRLPRGYGFVYSRLLGLVGSTYHGDHLFKAKLTRRHRVFYDRHLDCYVLADVGDAGSRNHYILGRYYENFVPLLIKKCLGPGDTFIDVGANRGVHTMFAARYLAEGRIISFEPNPSTFRVLQAHITINDLNNCKLYNMGLGDSDDTLTLHLFTDDTPSGCSFILKGENPVKETIEVLVRRLEDVLGAQDLSMRGRTLIKVDTEGFDHHVIRGMGKLLDHDQLAIVTEVVDDWLRRAGSSARGLFEDLRGRGFRAFLPSFRFRGGLKETLHLEPISQIPERSDQYDLVFAKPGMLSEVS
jgi:FkbM family methyltransferase